MFMLEALLQGLEGIYVESQLPKNQESLNFLFDDSTSLEESVDQNALPALPRKGSQTEICLSMRREIEEPPLLRSPYQFGTYYQSPSELHSIITDQIRCVQHRWRQRNSLSSNCIIGIESLERKILKLCKYFQTFKYIHQPVAFIEFSTNIGFSVAIYLIKKTCGNHGPDNVDSDRKAIANAMKSTNLRAKSAASRTLSSAVMKNNVDIVDQLICDLSRDALLMNKLTKKTCDYHQLREIHETSSRHYQTLSLLVDEIKSMKKYMTHTIL